MVSVLGLQAFHHSTNEWCLCMALTGQAFHHSTNGVYAWPWQVNGVCAWPWQVKPFIIQPCALDLGSGFQGCDEVARASAKLGF